LELKLEWNSKVNKVQTLKRESVGGWISNNSSISVSDAPFPVGNTLSVGWEGVGEVIGKTSGTGRIILNQETNFSSSQILIGHGKSQGSGISKSRRGIIDHDGEGELILRALGKVHLHRVGLRSRIGNTSNSSSGNVIVIGNSIEGSRKKDGVQVAIVISGSRSTSSGDTEGEVSW
jgi:hypothetical protein